MFRIKPVKSNEDILAFKSLLRIYGELRGHDKALGNYASEIENFPKAYEASLLAWSEEAIPAAIGCVAIRKIGEGICEMKRLFVLPKHQGKGVGKALSQEIIKISSKKFEVIRLDTHPNMLKARSLYQSLGFYEIPRYNQNPTVGISFFELQIKKTEDD
ncbi:MAG: GNAT family N-acetyltransferase [Bacteroidia bacterium]|nr:GNAT family N-acetyltransferase [Bacteroidia bacterium]